MDHAHCHRNPVVAVAHRAYTVVGRLRCRAHGNHRIRTVTACVDLLDGRERCVTIDRCTRGCGLVIYGHSTHPR